MDDLVARLREWVLIDDDLGSRDLRLWREAADEIERLRAQGATLREQHKQAHENSAKIFSALVDISVLTPLGGEVADYADVVAAVRALREDAERFDYIARRHALSVCRLVNGHGMAGDISEGARGVRLRAAIDEAMGKNAL